MAFSQSLKEGKKRNLCIFLNFLKVTYTHFVLGDIDFTKKCKNLAHLAEKISRACEGEDIMLFSFHVAKWSLHFRGNSVSLT